MKNPLARPFFIRRFLVFWVVGLSTLAFFGIGDLEGMGWAAVLPIVLGSYFGKNFDLSGMLKASKDKAQPPQTQ